MGAISEAIAKEARARAVRSHRSRSDLRAGERATRAGVALSDGSGNRGARRSPQESTRKLLYLRLVDPQALDPEFRLENRTLEVRSGTFRMNVALSELPDFFLRPRKTAQPHHSSGIIIAPSLAT